MKLATASRRLRIKAFPLGTWQVAWLGDVGLHLAHRSFSQLSYSITLREYPAKSNGRLVERALPGGMLDTTPIGSVWRDGQRVECDDPEETVRTFKISTSTLSLVKAGIAEDDSDAPEFMLPFETYCGHRRHTNSWLARFETEHDLDVLVPALEIIRFYFGSCSSLLTRIFGHAIDHRPLWMSINQQNEEHIHIDLGDDISGKAAADVARIALSDEARSVALGFWRALVANAESRSPAYPKVKFPFRGESIIRARGVLIRGRCRDRFVVHQLLSCTHPFPFKTLTYTAQGGPKPKARDTRDSALPASDPAQVKTTANRLGETASVADEEPKSRKKIFEVFLNNPAKFTDLTHKRIQRVTPPLESPIQIVGSRVVSDLGVGLGVGSGGALRARFSHETEQEYGSRSVKRPLFCPNTAWAPYFRLMEKLADTYSHWKIEFFPLARRQVHPHLSSIPDLVDDDGVYVYKATGRLVSVAIIDSEVTSLLTLSLVPVDSDTMIEICVARKHHGATWSSHDVLSILASCLLGHAAQDQIALEIICIADIEARIKALLNPSTSGTTTQRPLVEL